MRVAVHFPQARVATFSLAATGDSVMTSGIERDVDMLERDLAARLQLYQVSRDFCGDALHVSESLEELGKLYLKRRRLGDEHRAWKCFSRSVDVLQRLSRAALGTGSLQAAVALRNALCRIGGLHQERGQPGDVDTALNYLQRAMAINQRWSSGPALLQMALIQLRRVFLLLTRGQSGDADLAQDYFEHSLVGLEQLYKVDPWAIGEALALFEVLAVWHKKKGAPNSLVQIEEFHNRSIYYCNTFIDASRDIRAIQNDTISSLLCLGLEYRSRGLPGDTDRTRDCLQCALNMQQQENANHATDMADRNTASILELLEEIDQERGQRDDVVQAPS